MTGAPYPPSTAPPVYREEQRFRQWWVWLLVLAPAALAWWLFVQQIVLGQQVGTNPSPNWGVWLLWVIIGLGLPFFFGYTKLVLEVTRELIVIHYRPLSKRVIALSDVERVEARKYKAVKEYGGWGIKGWSRNNMTYNVYGNDGVELTLRDGRRVMLGSQQARELAEAIETQRTGRARERDLKLSSAPE